MENKIDTSNGKLHILTVDSVAYAVTTNASTSTWDFNESKESWEKEGKDVAGKKIVPYGDDNNLPTVIRNIMEGNNLAPGIIERECGLLYGDGPQLYSLDYTNGEVVRRYTADTEIEAWLATWDVRRYLQMAITEYKYMKGIFVRRYLNKGARIGTEGAKIAKLDVIPAAYARMEFVKNGSASDVKRFYVGDWENECIDGLVMYPSFDPAKPFDKPITVSYHNSYSFAHKFYSIPSYYGTLKWIMRSSDIPEILKYLTDNGINVAYHIHSPKAYWDDRYQILRETNPSATETELRKKLNDLRTELFKSMSEVLAGKQNAGKFIDTIDFYDDRGQQQSWKIEPIDHKVKEFIEAQLQIAEKADSATTSGLGLHPSLSNIIVNGQLSSGSQMLYALKLYLASDTTIPEEVIMEPINQAIKLNFPNSNLRLGFYHRVVLKEENVNPEDRVAKKV